MFNKKRRVRRATSDIIFDIIVYGFLIALCIAIILPFMLIITVSLSPPEVLSQYGLHIIPTKISLEGYRRVFQNNMIWTSYMNTIIRVGIGTLLNVALTVCAAYPLSKRYLPNRGFWTGIIIFTMYFSGGLIPSYMLVKNLGILNTMGSLILPNLIGAFNLIIVRNFFMGLPESIEESAKIDGANDFVILLRMILPLSKPIIATISLWYGVGHWNAWFDCMIYIMDEKKFILQMVLRKIILQGTLGQEAEMAGTVATVSPDTVKMATLIVSILPIICMYPFVQKYFVKGVMVGSLKG